MALVAVSIPNLISGVSQQPHTMRLSTSCSQLVNGWPSVVTGLSKRPPTELITKLNVDIDSNGTAYLIDKDNDYRYIVVIDNGGLKVYDIFGTEQTVSFPDGTGYLQAASSPVEDFRFLTVGDYTFILNRDVTVVPDDYGELGAGNYTANGVVQLASSLPSNVPNGTIYLVDSTDQYYKRLVQPYQPPIYQWVAQGNWDSTNDPGGTSVSALPATVVVGRILDLKRTTISGTRQVQQYDKATKKNRWVKQNIYKTQWRRYKGVETRPAIPAIDTWQLLRKADLVQEVLGKRLNPRGRATISVAQSVANSYYAIYVNDVLKADYLTKNGTDATNSVESTSVIAQALGSKLVAAGISVGMRGSSMCLAGLQDGDIIRCTSTNGDKAMKWFTTTVDQFSDLPPNDKDGRIAQIKGSLKDNGDDYWVCYQDGIWRETSAFGEGTVPAAISMPWVLIRNADGTWTFKPHKWIGRQAGDYLSNKGPSFVGFKLNDIFVYGNRLGFLADENVILSEAGRFENFYRTTVSTQLDSDPIDIAVLNTGNDVLYHAIPFNKDLILGSDRNQYRLSYQNYLSAKTIQVQFTTSFAMSAKVKPQNMGNSIYFVDDKPSYNFAKVWEYFPKETQAGDDAEEVTAPVPEYIDNNVKFMAASTRAKALVVGSEESPTKLFIYKYYWAGDRKVQNAWSTWEFPDCQAVYWCGFSREYMYMLIRRSDGVYLERLKFDETVTRAEVSSRILVDRQAQKERLVMTYDPNDTVLGKTTIVLPYSTNSDVEVIASWYGTYDDKSYNEVNAEERTVTDLRHVTEKLAPNIVKVIGNLTNADIVTVGIPYTFQYEFTTPYLREQKRNGEVVVLDGTRLQLRYMTLEYMDTAYFQTVLRYPGREDVVTTFDGKITGDATFITGATPYVTGKFRVALVGNNKDCTLFLKNDAPYNCSFGAAEWSCIYQPRAKVRM